MPFFPISRFRRRTRFRRRPRRTFRRSVRKTSNSVVNYRVPSYLRSYRGEYTIRKLRYTFSDGAGHTMDSTSGALSTDYVYRANSLYDPYAGAGGGQPRTFDQLIAMYRNFVVLGSKCHVMFGYGAASSTSADMQVAVCLKDGSTSIANSEDLMEEPRIKTKLMTAGRDNVTINHYYSFRISGAKDPVDETSLHGNASQDASEGWYYHIICFQPGGGTDAIHFTGWIEYTALFFHAIQPTAS